MARVRHPRAHGAVALVALALGCSGEGDLDGLQQRASALFAAGRLIEAAALLEPVLARATSQPADQRFWPLRALAAEVALERESGQPVHQLDGIPAVVEKGPLGARIEKVRGQIAVAQHQLVDARGHLDQAQRLDVGPPGSLAIEIALRRARLFAAEGNLGLAEATATRATQQAQVARERYWQAYGLYVGGYIKSLSEAYDPALAPLGQGLSIAREIGAEGLVSRLLYMTGISQYRLGDLDAARASLLEAGRVAERISAVFDLPDIEGDLGNIEILARNPWQAIARYEKAFALAQREAPGGAFRWVLNLTEACIYVGQWERAQRLSHESERLLRESGELLQLPYVRLHEALIAAGRQDLVLATRLLEEVIATSGNLVTLRWQSQVELGRIQAKRGHAALADGLFRQAIAGVEAARKDLSQIEHRLTFLTSLIDLYGGYVDVLIGEGQAEQALRLVEGSRAGILRASLGLAEPDGHADAFNPRAVAARLDATLLSFWVAPERSYEWLIDANGVVLVTLPGQAQLESLVEGYRSFIEDSLHDPRGMPQSPARTLYDVLIRPIAHRLSPQRPLIVAPDGPLHAVPFGALVTGAKPARFLIEEQPVAIAPSLALLPPGWAAKVVRSPRILAIGDPLPDGAEFPRLEQAAQELDAIARTFPGAVHIERRESARPEAYARDGLSGYSMIHIAAHAVANTVNPLASTIVLSPGQLSRRLTVKDVLATPVPADLVTLSACRTAGARVYSGEGLVGFSWAFLSAGARQVVAGLWDVGDGSTTALMTGFYQYLAAGETAVVALWRAQRDLLASEEYRTPYHWAAFNVYLGPGGNLARGGL